MLLASPALLVGYQFDDYYHLAVMEGFPAWPEVTRSPLGLFQFSSGEPDDIARLKERGMLAWWAAGDFKLWFSRPLTALTHWADHVVAPGSAALAHLHSLAWLGALVAVCAATFRRLMPHPAVASLAALLYAVDDARSMPAGWIAQRNAVVASFFGILALYLHDRWRRDGWRPGALLGPLAFLLGLLAGEVAVSAGGFLLAYALLRDPRRGLAALVPYLLVGAAWLAAYVSSGAGATGSGLYISPLESTGPFLQALPSRLLTLLNGSWGLGFLEVSWVIDLGWGPAIVGLILGGLVLTPLRRDPAARFWLLGTVLALLPMCATAPAERLLTLSGFGTAGLLALSVTSPLARREVVLGLLTVNLIWSSVMLPLRTFNLRSLGVAITTCADDPPDADTLIVVNATDACVGYLSLVRMARDQPSPERAWTLFSSFTGATIHRPDAQTLEVQADAGWQARPIEQLLRDARRPVAPGDVTTLSDMAVEVTAVTDDGRMKAVRFSFGAPLEDPRWTWRAWSPSGLVAWPLPAVGETVRVEAAVSLP